MSKKSFLNHSQNLYEFPFLRRVTGDTLRPGGLKATAKALELCEFSQGAQLLDVGCGAGASLAFLAEQGFKPVGMDTSSALLREAQARGPVIKGDAQALPFADSSFQGVFCECVVSLLEKPQVFFQNSYRVLEDNGWLVVSDIIRMPMPESAEPTPLLCASFLCNAPGVSGESKKNRESSEFRESGELREHNGFKEPDVSCPSGLSDDEAGSVSAESTFSCSPDNLHSRRHLGPPRSLQAQPMAGLTHEKSCLDGAQSQLAMEQLFQEHGFIVRHVLDYRRSLVELAAKMVWEFGSMKAFWELWQQKNPEGCGKAPCAKQFGYALFLGQKRRKTRFLPQEHERGQAEYKKEIP